MSEFNTDNNIKFYLNQELKNINYEDPRKTVLEYLRENNYFGTKYGCGEGGCGACTVVTAEFDYKKHKIKYRTANSCLLPLYSLNNKQVITIEGIGSPENPHPVQERMAKTHASQCGYCSPGIVMSLYGLLKINPSPSLHDIEEGFDGNLCRCTGYRPILDCARTFSSEKQQYDDCSPFKTNECSLNSKKIYEFLEFKPYDPLSHDASFPQDLVKCSKQDKTIMVKYEDKHFNQTITWIEPKNLEDLLKYKTEYLDSKIIAGNTEVGIEMKFKYMNYKTFINISNITEIKNLEIKEEDDEKRYLEIGVNITLTELIENLNELKKQKLLKNKAETSLINSMLSNLKWFASKQIRNFATLAGNIITGSPISDMNPIFMANDSVLSILTSSGSIQNVQMRKFYLSYRKNIMKPDEVLLNINVPLPNNEYEFVKAYKQSKRKDDDIAIVNACLKVKLDKINDSSYKINCLDIAYGGLGIFTIYLNNVKEKTQNIIWSELSTLNLIQDMILNELNNITYSVPGGMPTYRRTLAISFFTRFWYQTLKELNIDVFDDIEEIERDISSGSQDFGTIKQDPYISTINPHLSALKQTTGVAKYLDDIPKLYDELHAGLVLSTKPHAYIKSIDTSKALGLKGVVDFISHKDVPHENLFGIFKDEEYFASEKVLFNGQLIGLIIAESSSLARKAANLVEITYEEIDKPILTIEDAIQKNSFYEKYDRQIQRGEIKDETFINLEEDELVFEGTCKVGGQEHFYLETQCCLIVPKLEDNEFEVISSTQNPSEIQSEVASILGIPRNRVVCRVKRLGGGFGGKETRATLIAATSAVAANKLKRPIRCVLDRDIDMMISGTRHPFLGKYKIKITKNGLFKAYDLQLYSNAGHSYDLSIGVTDRAVVHCDNVYYFPNQRVSAKLCKTNIASNTAFRGFGGPQGMLITEMMICEVAEKLNLDPYVIRAANIYKPLQKTHFDKILHDWFLPEIWDNMIKDSEYQNHRKECNTFNLKYKWKKRGLTLLPTKYGLGFGPRFLNQAGALVNIYVDGSVLISHGGVEMGQGLHTKMIQICANALHTSIETVHITETATDKVPNASATAASVSSDIYGMAILNACNQLNERLKPYREANPNGTLKDWANAAYFDRVNLSANGFYKTPDLDYDWNTNKGNLFSYFVSGVAMTMVELDLFTGDYTILTSDLYMDIGQSINFAIDIGQIEGAFMQGVGLCTIEETLVLSSNGSLLTRGPGNYKIPGFRDVPIKLNVKLLQDKEYKNLKTIKTSKGVGEPPLFLGTSVFFALRDAVLSARKSNGIREPLKGFDSPCTCETLRLACEDELVKKATVLPKLLFAESNNSDEKKEYEKLWAIRP